MKEDGPTHCTDGSKAWGQPLRAEGVVTEGSLRRNVMKMVEKKSEVVRKALPWKLAQQTSLALGVKTLVLSSISYTEYHIIKMRSMPIAFPINIRRFPHTKLCGLQIQRLPQDHMAFLLVIMQPTTTWSRCCVQLKMHCSLTIPGEDDPSSIGSWLLLHDGSTIKTCPCRAPSPRTISPL